MNRGAAKCVCLGRCRARRRRQRRLQKVLVFFYCVCIFFGCFVIARDVEFHKSQSEFVGRELLFRLEQFAHCNYLS